MKLLYITTRISGAGGMQRVLSVKTDYLVKEGYDITILTTNADASDVIYEFNPEISIYNIRPDRNTFKYFQSYKTLLSDIVDKISPDIVIMCDNGLKGFLLPFILKKKYPLVYERHGSKFIKEEANEKNLFSNLKDAAMYRFMDYSAKRFDRFVGLTQAARKEWEEGIVTVISNPLWVETEEVSNLDRKVVIAVGRHTYEKGYDRMFEIWATVIKKHRDWTLKIYGDCDEKYDIRALAQKFGVLSNVEFLPSQKDIVSAYQQASVYLMTSRSEGFGMVLLEAMACGVPCIAFDCPVGPSEIIQDGYNGFLITDGDIDDYTAKVNMLITDETLRKKTGEQAKQSVSRFEIEAIMNKWMLLFKNLK